MEKKKKSVMFKIIRWLVWFFYPKTELVGLENIPSEACIIVGNHAQMNGPIVSELYIPSPKYTWCAGEMMVFKEVPKYAYQDFWSQKPRCVRWFFKIAAYCIPPLSVCVFNNADTIPVFHDTRILTTFRESIQMLQSGADLVIFPEYDKPYNNIIYDFQDKFIDLARMYYKKTGKELPFVPLYIAPKLKKAFFGSPIRFDSAAPKEAERHRICEYLMESISEIAYALPEHTVIPYRNIPKKLYPKNRPLESSDHEKNTL